MALRLKKKTVAIIGAGQCGLVTMKTLAENGYSVHTYEINDDIGGLWNYEANKTRTGQPYERTHSSPCMPLATSYSTLRMNTSVWSSVYSDFPPQEGMYDEFFTHQQYTEYLKQYAKRFKLYKDIEFNTRVMKLDKVLTPTKGWTITLKKDDIISQKQFTFVVVCSGAYNYQKIPNIPGLYDFKGTVIQSNQIRDPGPLFRDKVVCVIGGSVTGADLACNALKSNPTKVYVSASSRPTERNRWYMDRYPNTPRADRPTIPWDMQVTRDKYTQSHMIYYKTFQQFMKPFVVQNNSKPDTEPTYGIDAWMVADTRLIKRETESGRLQLLDTISEIKPSEIVLRNGSTINNVDLIVIATGFKKRFPFLDHVWSETDQNKFELFNHILPLPERLDGIAFTGLTGAPIGVFVVAEMQARWLAKEWSNKSYNKLGNLYTSETRISMKESVKYLKSVSKMAYNYISDPYTYLDSLAHFIGCMPMGLATDFTSAIKQSRNMKDIELAVAVYHGPFIACHYRLTSDNSHIRRMAESTAIMVAKRYLGDRFHDYVHYYSDSRFKLGLGEEEQRMN